VRTCVFLYLPIASLLSGCATDSLSPGLIYGLDDSELNMLGRRLGYRVEALGMSDYRFSRADHSFRVIAHNDISVRHRAQADEPVELRGAVGGTRKTLSSYLSVQHGVPLAAVEEHFREFIRATHLRRI